MKNTDKFQQALSEIKLIVFDIDGVFTDGRIWLDDQGNETKSFNVRDGHGIKLLLHYGVDVAVLSGRKSRAVDVRMQELGVDEIWQGHIDKRTAFDAIIQQKQLEKKEVAYAGDDIVDVQAMRLAGVSFAVADAHHWVQEHASLITKKPGGHGAVREICELILEAKGLLDTALDFNL